MPALLLALLSLLAHAYDVGDWPEAELKAQVARVADPGAEVLEARGVPLAHAGAVTGAILGRFRLGEHTYCHVQTVYEKAGQTWVTGGWGAGGCERVALLGVLDLAGEGRLVLHDGWALAQPQEPTAKPKKPALAVLSSVRFDDGQERIELLLLDLADLDRPFQILRETAGTHLPIWDPHAGMPVQRSLGREAQSVAITQAGAGSELLLASIDLPTPDARCLEPEPEIRRFQLQEGRFVELRSPPPPPTCP